MYYVVTWKTGDGNAHSVSFKNVEDADAAANFLTCMNAMDVRVSKAGKQVRFSVNNSGEIVVARAV